MGDIRKIALPKLLPLSGGDSVFTKHYTTAFLKNQETREKPEGGETACFGGGRYFGKPRNQPSSR
jgi:hypothetical protein